MSKILSWHKEKPAGGLVYPISREGHSLTYVEGLGIIMFGGFGARLLNELHLYEIGENRWKIIKAGGL